MAEQRRKQIAFEVETSRVLEILSSQIYDSPKAFLRENVQNAYDAILMRCVAKNLPIAERSISITVVENRLEVRDDGIGMTEDTLTNSFWKAGSSGKHTELARRSGVIGTFGIGAMANFGVCSSLRVTTKHIDSPLTLISSARRDALRIAEDCIELHEVADDRRPGTTVEAELDPQYAVSADQIVAYLEQYVRFLPVPVSVNGRLISQESFQDTLGARAEGFDRIASRPVARDGFAATLHVSTDAASRVLARLTDLSLHGNPCVGEVFLVQQGGVTHGFRNLFGLAPIPVSGHYRFGGFVDLDLLHPTAGREALSRQSIQHVNALVALIEAEATADVARSPAADRNLQFQRYVAAHGLFSLAQRVTITVLPGDRQVALGDVSKFEEEKAKHYYTGRDQAILNRFAGDQANLFHVSQAAPRRTVQLGVLSLIPGLQEVPDRALVDRISPLQLSFDEAMFLVRLRSILLSDYLMADVDVALATISHGVSVDVQSRSGKLQVSIARELSAVARVVQGYKTARDVFDGLVRDFAREYLYVHIRDYVPSSTKQGHDGLLERLQRSKHRFRLREEDYGPIEAVLTDYLAGRAEFSDVLRAAREGSLVQHQQVTSEQVGTVEQELPGVVGSNDSGSGDVHEAAPPIIRADVESEMKVLTIGPDHPPLNGHRMFLALSDRLVMEQGEFMHWPHTTRLIWGRHRVTYIFTDATGQLSLYYDIELDSPLASDQTGGAMLPTATIVTKNRVFVPVPDNLHTAFAITNGEKQFMVRFDTIP